MSLKDNKKVYFGNKKVTQLEKEEGVQQIFSKVAKNYDLMNDLMSLGMHRLWKRIFVQKAGLVKNSLVLDLAAGTGDITKIILDESRTSKVVLCDQNAEMVAKAKDRAVNEGFINNVTFEIASAEKLPFKNNQFNKIFISFGFRNFSNKEQSLKELLRVLKPKGTLHILEFSKVKNEVLSKVYDIYSKTLIPKIGNFISNDAGSYQYLVDSIDTHEDQEGLKFMIENSGFRDVSYENLFDGIVSIHIGKK